MANIEINDEEFFDLICLQVFLSNQFRIGKIKARTLKKVLFTTECLLDKDFIAFRQEEHNINLEYMRDANPEFEKFEEILDNLADYVNDGIYTFDQILSVIFGQCYIKNGEIIYSQN